MAISTGSGRGKVNADINVTPMIDVMLVLLIIFMIVTPLIAAGFQATLPKGKDPHSVTLEEAVEFITAKAGKAPVKKVAAKKTAPKAAVKKAPAKKAPAKKPAAKKA